MGACESESQLQVGMISRQPTIIGRAPYVSLTEGANKVDGASSNIWSNGWLHLGGCICLLFLFPVITLSTMRKCLEKDKGGWSSC